MSHQAILWLLFNLVSLIFLAFFSMEEMACISFNKIRLQYYVSQGSKRAKWLYTLMQHPSRLFGTTLIGVNIATFIGSECAREFHASVGLDPDLAPLSQVIIVIIFGELAPQFAARSYPEHVAMLGAPLLYAFSVLMAPFIWILGWVSRAANYVIGGKEPHPDLFLTIDELQKIVESQGEEPLKTAENEDVNLIAINIFNLKGKTAKTAMDPLDTVWMIPANTSVVQARKLLPPHLSYMLVYHKDRTHIVGIVFIRELLNAPFHKQIRDYSHSAWFISENASLIQIMKQFRRNNESVAVVLNGKGQPEGIVSLDAIIEEIFGKENTVSELSPQAMMIDRTLPGAMTLKEFNQEFSANLQAEGAETLSDMLVALLEHTPEKGESVWIPPYEFTIKETSLLEIKTISVKTKI